jgi:ADP-heptose:LPS heptosyltransferase
MVKVLIIKPSSLGDIIHSVRAVELIARARADCRVTWLVNEEYAAFVRELPGVFEVLPFPRRGLGLSAFPACGPRAVHWLGKLRRGFDVAVDLQGLQRSGLMARLCGAAERFGPREARELGWLHYNRPVSIPRTLRHAVDRVEYLAAAVCARSALLGSAPLSRTGIDLGVQRPFRLPVPPAARREADAILSGDARRPVVLCPGTRWPSKLWPAVRWGELLDILARRRPDLRPIFMGAPGEQSLVWEILASTAAPGENLVGRASLWQTAALMERAAAVVTMDSAPLHLAALLEIPTVALFGPTDPGRVAPRGPQHRVARLDLECLACYKRECPLPRRACLRDLDAETVYETLLGVLDN